eukprot:m.63083 g.63083  ORF g.63083 m.63083 type:complete len:59 (-) comp8131_c1_seq1:199-375(-)
MPRLTVLDETKASQAEDGGTERAQSDAGTEDGGLERSVSNVSAESADGLRLRTQSSFV